MNLSTIKFDIDNLDPINSNIWHPSESDKKYMSQTIFDEEMEKYNEKKSKLIFTNCKVNYDSCDCGGGYPCNHSSYPYEIEVMDGDDTHIIGIEGKDTLEFFNDKTKSCITISGIQNLTYADFYKFCQLCDIKLISNYVI